VTNLTDKNQPSDVKNLYKYVSLSEWDFENIYKEQIFLRTASSFNDVFDSAPYYNKDVFNTILKKHIDEYGMNLPSSLSSNIQSIEEKSNIFRRYFRNIWDSAYQDSALITCFTEDKHSNIMWAHYGDLYQGAVIEYDANELISAARNHLIKLKEKGMFNISNEILKRGPMLEKVMYSEYRSDISDDLLKAHDLIMKYGEPSDYNDSKYDEIKLTNEKFKEQQRALFYTKAKEWSYEKEWRLIIPNYFPEKAIPHTQHGKTLVIKLKPKAIILGYKIPKYKAKGIIQLCIEKNISLYGSGPDYFSDKPSIVVEPLKESFIIEMLK